MAISKVLFEDKAFREKMLKTVEFGLVPYRAAILAGTTAKTYYLWEKLRKEDEDAGLDETTSKYIAFFNDIERAKQKNVEMHLQNISNSAKRGNWTASAWVLERVHGEEFKKVDNVNVESDTIKIVATMPTHEDSE